MTDTGPGRACETFLENFIKEENSFEKILFRLYSQHIIVRCLDSMLFFDSYTNSFCGKDKFYATFQPKVRITSGFV